VIHHATGSTDHNLDTALQAPELPLVRLTAIDGQCFDALVATVLVKGLGDLNREFSRRAEDQGLYATHLRINRFDDWQTEGRGLAGTGLRLGNDVLAFEQDRDHPFLNWRRDFIADGLDAFQELPVQSKIGERNRVLGCFCDGFVDADGDVSQTGIGTVILDIGCLRVFTIEHGGAAFLEREHGLMEPDQRPECTSVGEKR
jgi:hypothetical protein